MMIGNLCRFYGWGLTEVLEMDCRHFWMMWRAYRKIDAMEKIELVEIAAQPNQSIKYSKFLIERYESRLVEYDKLESPQKFEKPAPMKSSRIIEADSQLAANIFIRAFEQKKRGG